MVLCGPKNASSMASLEEPFEASLFLRVYYCFFYCIFDQRNAALRDFFKKKN